MPKAGPLGEGLSLEQRMKVQVFGYKRGRGDGWKYDQYLARPAGSCRPLRALLRKGKKACMVMLCGIWYAFKACRRLAKLWNVFGGKEHAHFLLLVQKRAKGVLRAGEKL